MPNPTHKDLIREEFTRQATEYAAAPVIRDEAHIERLVRAVDPAPDARVLEVATGPGYIAMAFAGVAREVVGVDLTEAPLKIAEQKRGERGLNNVSFRTADAENLPFPDGEFDIVVCRFAVHHFENPRRVLGEMARVCRVGGTIGIEDMVASEHPERAEYHNRFERLRDTSHTRALPMSELLAAIRGEPEPATPNVSEATLLRRMKVQRLRDTLTAGSPMPEAAISAGVRRAARLDVRRRRRTADAERALPPRLLGVRRHRSLASVASSATPP